MSMLQRGVILIPLLILAWSSGNANGQTAQLALEDMRAFTEAFARVQRDYVGETTDTELMESAIRGMLSELDPHSSYLTRDQYRALSEDSSGRYGGVGIEVLWINGELTVANVMPDTPAARAGIVDGERITAVDGELVTDHPEALTMARVRGEAGTDVRLTVANLDNSKTRDVTLTREVIAVASVDGNLIDNQFAHITVVTFQSDTGDEVSHMLDQLKSEASQPLAGLILDLRGNPGGVLGAAVSLSDLFLTEGKIVYTKSRNPQGELEFSAGPDDEMGGAPIVILVDETTASAAEIVAGALQDHGRGLVIGTRTFGKGSVQNVIPLSNGSAVKLTTARYYTPAGRSIQQSGIAPDIDLSGDSHAMDFESTTLRELDLEGSLANEAPTDHSDSNAGLADEDYPLYRALAILKSYHILSKLDR